jgi:hypothetical protein
MFYGKQFMPSTTAKNIWMVLHSWASNFLPPVRSEEAEQLAQGFQSISTQGCIWNCTAGNQVVVFTPTDVAFDWHSTMLRDVAAVEEFEEMVSEFVGARCHNRDTSMMVQEIHALQLTHVGM